MALGSEDLESRRAQHAIDHRELAERRPMCVRERADERVVDELLLWHLEDERFERGGPRAGEREHLRPDGGVRGRDGWDGVCVYR